MDANDLLRVGGRHQHSAYSYNKRHPILLPKNNHFTTLVFRETHLKLLHAGPKLLLSIIREQFWPIQGKNIAKKIVRDCVQCTRYNGRTPQVIMGSLPTQRIHPSPPFNNTSVDYCGPFMLKDKLGRGAKTIKGYVCLFICFSTKAIHLDLITSLTTNGFIAMFKRFISRRGKPHQDFSDNGTNFIGAKSELNKLGEFLQMNNKHVCDIFSKDRIQ